MATKDVQHVSTTLLGVSTWFNHSFGLQQRHGHLGDRPTKRDREDATGGNWGPTTPGGCI